MARIVQLTDLHLKTRKGLRTRGVDPWALLDSALAAVAETRPALVVVTGDVAADPKAATYRLLRGLLDGRAAQVRVLPGNHDRRELLREAFGVGGAHDTVNFVESIGGWRLVGLDTLRPRRIHGRLGDGQLEWLQTLLRQGSDPTVLFMHHPPVRIGTWWLDRDLVRDVERFREVVQASGRVRAICCGHVHQEHHDRFAGADVWTTPSTAYQFRPRTLVPARLDRARPGFRVLDLEGESIATRVVRLNA